MSFSVVHDTVSVHRGKKRSPFLTCSGHPDAAPIPPTLVNSPHLSSPNSVFRRKSYLSRWPSQREDDWLRDMVPIDVPSISDVDAKSEASTSSSDSATPSPTPSENSFGLLLFPPSPMLRPRSISLDVPTPPLARRASAQHGGSGFGLSPHN